MLCSVGLSLDFAEEDVADDDDGGSMAGGLAVCRPVEHGTPPTDDIPESPETPHELVSGRAPEEGEMTCVFRPLPLL